jgi:hypothetical protein
MASAGESGWPPRGRSGFIVSSIECMDTRPGANRIAEAADRVNHAPSGVQNGMPLLIEVVIVLIVVGVVLWLINTYIPMAGPIKSILNFVVVIAVIVWLLQAFGLWNSVLHFKA